MAKSIIKPIGGLNLDSDPKYLKATEYSFAKNLYYSVNKNTDSPGDDTQGGNERSVTPAPSNQQFCDLQLPSGENQCIGSFEFTELGEAYIFNWNSLNSHGIYRMNIEAGTCDKVYVGSCLNFNLDYPIGEHNVNLRLAYNSPIQGASAIFKYLIWTDGLNPQGFIDVETSIATDSFNSTTHPYFNVLKPHCDICEFIQLGVRPPYSCPVVTAIPYNASTDENVPNYLLNNTWQFRARYVLYDGRTSAYSSISQLIYVGGGSCNKNGLGLSRCFNLKIYAGAWNVERIEILFRNCNGNAGDLTTPTDWYLYDTIYKYDSANAANVGVNFWEREITLPDYCASSGACGDGFIQASTYTWNLSSVTYPFSPLSIIVDGETFTSNETVNSAVGLLVNLTGLNVGEFELVGNELSITVIGGSAYGNIITGESAIVPEVDTRFIECDVNTFNYRFCGDKNCTPVAVANTNRIYDDLGITSEALTSIDDKLVQGSPVKLYDNIANEILDKIEFTVTKPDRDAACEIEFVKIFGYIVIHNPYLLFNEPIHKDDDVGIIAWGGLGTMAVINAPYVKTVGTDYRQNFGSDEDAAGFLIGIRGTNYVTRTKQRTIDINRNIISETPFENSTGDGNRARIARNISIDNFYAQYFELIVPKGVHVLEVYGHDISINDTNLRNTSTFVVGTAPAYNPVTSLGLGYGLTEFKVEACDGDYDFVDNSGWIVISDLTYPQNFAEPESTSYFGYLTEKENTTPIELASFNITQGSGNYTHINSYVGWKSRMTDHNGFYFFTVEKGLFASSGEAEFFGFQSCNTFQIASYTIPANPQNKAYPTDVHQLSELGTGLYNDCAHILVTGRVLGCDGVTPLANQAVVMDFERVVYTDSTGAFTFKLHAFVETQSRTGGYILLPQNGICMLVGCEDCDMCSDELQIFLPDFNDCVNQFTCPEYTYTAANFNVRYANEFLKGLKSGRTYLVSVILEDFMGRTTSAQANYTIETPPITDLNGVFAPSVLSWSLTAPTVFPLNFKYFSIAIERQIDIYLQWVASKIEFVDAKGNEITNVSATYIKISIDGLLNYNTLNNLKTNTAYQFVEGDRIRVYDDGSTTSAGLFDVGTFGIIDLQVRGSVDGNSILIDYDDRLKDIKLGTWFELYRPTQCIGKTLYFERCPKYVLIAGQIVDSDLVPIAVGEVNIIPTFDTYFIYRSIPQKDANDTDNVFTTYHPYEHNAPSDFWGSNCQDIGRVFTEDKDSKQTKRKGEMSFSDNFVNDGLVNGFGTWRTENKVDYPGYGAIKAIYCQGENALVVCELDWFTIRINPQYTRVNSQGFIEAMPEIFLSKPTPKIGIKTGVSLQSAIKFIPGLATWFDDRISAWIVCDWNKAVDVSEGLVKSYLYDRTTAYKLFNKTAISSFFKYFVNMGYDPKNNSFILTWFSRYSFESAPDPFINNEREVNTHLGETLIYDYQYGTFRTFAAFTPEYYSQARTGLNQKQLIAFKNGQPYTHNNPTLLSWNEFFGVATDDVIEIVLNEGQTDIKAVEAIDIESDMMWYVDKVTTNIPNMLSTIPAIRMKNEGNVWHGEFLRNINTIGGLYRGKPIQGFYTKIRLVRDNTLNYFLSTFDDTKRKRYSLLDNIIVKFKKLMRTGD